MIYIDDKNQKHEFSSVEEWLKFMNKNTPWLKKFKYKLFHKLTNLKYTIKDSIKPHNVIKIKTLNKGWHDFDSKFLHAAFQLFSDFVEKEHGLDSLKYQFTYLETNNEFDFEKAKKDLGHNISYEEALNYYLDNKQLYELSLDQYEWWQKYTKNPPIFESFDQEEAQVKEENRRLNLLVEKRNYYWT